MIIEINFIPTQGILCLLVSTTMLSSVVGKHLLVPDKRSSAIDVFAVNEEDTRKLREVALSALPLGYSPSCMALV